jgi:pilus assembly protein CpaC
MADKHVPVFLMAMALSVLTCAAWPVVAQAAPEVRAAEEVKVYAGKSRVVKAPWPVKRVAVTDPKIADVQILTPRQVLLQGKKPGRTDLVMWSAGEDIQTSNVAVLLDIQALQEQLRKLFPNTTLSISQSDDVIIATGSLSSTTQVERLHNFLDSQKIKFVDMTDLAGVQQVMLQVRVAEVSRTALRTLGINAFHTGNDFFGGSTVGASAGGAINPISIGPVSGTPARHGVPFVFNADVAVSPSITLFAGFPEVDLQLFLQALAENQYLRILAEPTLIALSGKEATFLAGGEFPIPVVQGTTTGGGTSISIEYREFGVGLTFRPIVQGDGTIQLWVLQEVSELTDTGAVELQGFRVPGLITRRTSTTVELKSRQSFAIAGLISRTTTARASRVPGLGDMPVLGALFRSVRYTSGETELVVLVTAAVVEPLSAQTRPPSPGMSHLAPNDWELYALGRIEGQVIPKLSPVDVQSLKQMGLEKLKGPGAWVRYGQRPAHSQANLASESPRD